MESSDVGVPDVGVPTDCDHHGFDLANGTIIETIPGRLGFRAASGRDRFEIDLVFGGVQEGADGVGNWELAGQRYDNCSTCVVIRQGCDDAGACEKVYYATEGILRIDQWSADGFQAGLEDVLLREVNVDNPIRVTPRTNGERWCMEGTELATDIVPPLAAAIAPEGQCMSAGQGAFMGHNVADFSLLNCLGEPVSIHGRCGQSLALWIMGSTGWCAPCSAKLRRLAEEHGGFLTREAVGEQTPGLDLLVVISEDTQHDPPDQDFCLAYAEAHHIDPAMVLLDHSVDGIELPLIDPPMTPRRFHSMSTTWSHINPYLARVTSSGGGTGVQFEYPWNALLRGTSMEYYWSEYADVGRFESARDELLSE
jgi:hypothetical protein